MNNESLLADKAVVPFALLCWAHFRMNLGVNYHENRADVFGAFVL
jgi:hypothetical protein